MGFERMEHLTLLVGNEEIASTLIRHFGSMKALSHPSLLQIRQFLPHRKAEAVVAAFSVSTIAESEHARSEVFDNPESVYRACAEMKLLNQEVLRIVLLDAKRRLISIVDIRKGTLNESLAYPREIFRTVILNAAYAFVLVHNHPVRPVKTTLRPSFPGHLGSTSSWPRPACQFGHTSLQPVHIDITASKRHFTRRG
jgi:DNA repair protein RadC